MIVVRMVPSMDPEGSIAVIDGWRWESDNPLWKRTLNAELDPFGPPGDIPYPDLDAAQQAVERYPGSYIVQQILDPYPPKSDIL